MTTRTPAPTRSTGTRTTAPILGGIPFTLMLRVEWGKATDTRAARWLLAGVAATTIGLELVPLLNAGTAQSYSSYLGFAAIALSILLPVVAILTLTSEWSQRTALTTFTQESRRLRVVNAKIIVSLMLGAGAAVFGGLVTAAGVATAEVSGRTVDADLDAGLLLTFLLYVLLNVMTGVALGALVHNSAAAVVASFVLPVGFGLLGTTSHLVAQWLDYSTAFTWVLKGQWSGHEPNITVAVVLWVAAPLTLGLIHIARREIH